MRKLLEKLGIGISESAKCEFEYTDDLIWTQENRPEGTSFDFHISDGEQEYFFEIKFTENGFGKAKNDDYHKAKIESFYRKKIREVINREVKVEECIKYYQLFRNIIRGKSDKETIVFITDNNNFATRNSLDNFINGYLKGSKIKVIDVSWQEVYKQWPKNIEKPFQFTCFKHD